MENELVRYSRAGDAFHYRWAARRCLRMIYPKSRLQSIIIEGSKESASAGEYVIDVAEYSESADDGSQEIAYYQLKHTTVRNKQPLNLSGLKDTIIGFAKRYSDHFQGEREPPSPSTVTFSIVTNRPLSESFKQNIFKIGRGETVSPRFQNTIENYTNLKGTDLYQFCASLKFADGEGDYNAQRCELHAEISQLLTGVVDDPQVDNIIALVRDRALPDSNGKIVREDILKRFGVTFDRDLYPAPPEFEKLINPIPRKQHQTLLDSILNTTSPIIIHASGGVGKSVFACQIADSLPMGSLGVVYDCFGGGKYRNRSEPRHRHRDGLVQIVNELASKGLCDPLIAQSTALEDEILRKFLWGIRKAVKALRNANENAVLVILIDAADNAEMAAKEFSQSCFVHELLRESLPDGCRLVALCRTERIHLLQPSEEIFRLELKPFTLEETLIHLRRHFPQATETDGLEFHRLTNDGNPRVQANALRLGKGTITETLASLGPSGTKVDDQIEAQLNAAISAVKKNVTADYQYRINAICLGLANLPPFIPINVLAAAAEVDESTVKSFVADLGHPLWLSDNSVQFRDEPTETWFRRKFSATVDQITNYIKRLEPLAYDYPYVAETLPSLLLQSGKYRELIDLALSDKFLPEDNPITERNVRVYRLQFAFKAALKQQRYVDAVRLALRAGEETASDDRQIDLLKRNVDLIGPLQNEQRVQELAFKRMLRSDWDGSENVYSAALLSSVEAFKGEARGYLRSARNWLHLYFEERKKSKGNIHDDKLKIEDIVELTYVHFNLFGVSRTVEFIRSWRPKEFIYRISQPFIRRLIDAGDFEAVNEIVQISSRTPYLMIALAHELLEVGRFPGADSMDQCLTLLTTRRTRIPKPPHFPDEKTLSALLSFIEACAARKLSKKKILRVLRHYVPIRASTFVSYTHQNRNRVRNSYLRAVALRSVLLGNIEPNLDELLPKEFVEEKQNYSAEQNVREFKEIIGGLLPWYIVRTLILINNIADFYQAIKDAERQSNSATEPWRRDSYNVLYEISQIWVEILTLYRSADPCQIEKFFIDYLKENKQFEIQDRLKAVRCAFRSDNLLRIRSRLEQFAYKIVASSSNEYSETRANWYIDLSRAVLPVSHDDAAAYFNYAIEAVSKFGDEIVQRWEAVASLANQSAKGGFATPEMTYRFIRCAELVGDNLYREKYWDRNDAVRICVRLSPNSALAALSRWRDRYVGMFERQLPALAIELVESNYLSPSVGWSLSAFFEGDELDDFAMLCIEKERSIVSRRYILDTAIRDLRLNESEEESWQKLKKITQQYSLENSLLHDILTFYNKNPNKKSEERNRQNSLTSNQDDLEPIDWKKIFHNLELTTSPGINQAIKNFNAASVRYRNYNAFWEEICKRIDESEVNKFLHSLVEAEYDGMYNMRDFFSCMPPAWLNKVSVKKNWGSILQMIARRFADAFTHGHGLEYFFENIDVEENDMALIRKGILDGLYGKSDFADAGTFFGFVDIVSPLITPQQATDLLDFALGRFEMHIDNEYADGGWAKWLNPPEEISMAFTGFVWSALGSSRTETRWRAAHCIRRLADIGCDREIHDLIQWMEHDKVDAFGCHKFHFYNLHARQYLLIAFARVSIDHPGILRRYHDIFLQHALSTDSGILIRKFSAEIALNIEKMFPNTYSRDNVQQLHQVGVSRLPIKKKHRDTDKLESYWHRKGEVDTNLEFHYELDFYRYWFEPLGNVFGISSKQVEELATEVIINEWRVDTDEGFARDPRKEFWLSSQNDRKTWHSHGSYPQADTYSFYLSYHAMLVVAGKLLQKMPVVHRDEWYEDEWVEWLHRHTLTRTDGLWLSDRRDPAPLLKPDWISQEEMKNCRTEITGNDFLDMLLIERKDETWLNVFGTWEESDYRRMESVYFSTALVAPAASQSLLNALTTCSNPHDFKLPDYKEEDMEFKSFPFELKGWICREDKDNRLDEYDPYAGQLTFPPFDVGQSIVEKMELFADSEKREWFLTGSKNASLLCDLWCTNKPGPNEAPRRRGSRLSASLTFLKKLCMVLECEIIFNLEIVRRLNYNYNMREEDETKYKPPDNKIYILSADGKLRDTETHYQLR